MIDESLKNRLLQQQTKKKNNKTQTLSVNPLRGYESKGLATRDPPGGALPHGQLHTASESPLPAGSAVSFRPCCIMGRISAKQQPFLLALWCAPPLKVGVERGPAV
uniref:Uncharacterized protein n=1 Tax=Anguilla anguilla TaxID=7936 RepID=A0A0E9X8A0_ANGAN